MKAKGSPPPTPFATLSDLPRQQGSAQQILETLNSAQIDVVRAASSVAEESSFGLHDPDLQWSLANAANASANPNAENLGRLTASALQCQARSSSTWQMLAGALFMLVGVLLTIAGGLTIAVSLGVATTGLLSPLTPLGAKVAAGLTVAGLSTLAIGVGLFSTAPTVNEPLQKEGQNIDLAGFSTTGQCSRSR